MCPVGVACVWVLAKRLKFLSNFDPRAYEKGYLLVMALPKNRRPGHVHTFSNRFACVVILRS